MKQVFINLPVENIDRSMEFYTKLGISPNPLFSDGQQKCMVWSESIYVMLRDKKSFFHHSFNKKTIPDTKNNITATFTLPLESLDRLNETIESGLRAGGSEPSPPIDEGFMLVKTLEDFDGHTWGFIYLDLNKFKEQKK